MQGPGRRDPAVELRHALIEALVETPVATSALSDRRLLISLIKMDAAAFPDIGERAEARLHTIEIVRGCLECPGGLRALLTALTAMAPDAAGTRRIRQLIESASMLSLLPEAEIKKVRELLKRAGRRPELDSWKDLVDEFAPHVKDQSATIVQAFDLLAARGAGQHGTPPALIMISRVAAALDDPLAVELVDWVREQCKRLDVPEPDAFDDDESEAILDQQGGEPHDSSATVDHDLARRPEEDPFAAAAHDRSLVLATIAGDNPDISAPIADDGDVMASVASTRRTTTDKLPQVWGDVPARNPHFTGREGLLGHLHDELRAARETAVLPQALHGMGGVGKSQVAIEYVHRHSSEFDLIWWIPAEQPGQILSSLTKLAQRLELEVGPEANSAVPAVREALSTGQTRYENWLLVFDNAEDLHEVRAYFPTGGAGKILVTSRNPDWAGVARALEVDVFTREESKRFLINRTPELSDTDADRLAEALGDLPLAVEQAAAWRAATGMPVDEYLALLEDKRIELLDDTSAPDYQISVAAAWKISLDRLERVNLSALQLLQVCSFFAPEPISRWLFAGSPSAPITDALDDTLNDQIKLSRAIRDIQRYALARFDHRNDTLQMHRLVQAVLVGRMTADERDVMRRGAHTLLANGNPNRPSRRDQWERYQSLRPHLMVSRAVESADPRVQALVFGTIEFLYHWGDHDGCEELAEGGYKYRLAQYGEASPHTLRVAKWLGFIRWVLGQYEASAELNQRTLDLYLATFGEEDDGTVDAMPMVAQNLRAKGDFDGARDLDDRAVTIARRVFGEDDPETLKPAHDLGVCLRLTGEFKRAVALDEDTYRRSSAVFGENADRTLNTLNGLTIDLRESGDYVGAHVRQEDAYQRHLAAFGPQNPATMRAARNLAVARRKAGDHEGARQLSEETLEKFRRRYGDDYPDTMAAAMNVAVDLRHAGELEAARELGEATLTRYERTFGKHHPHTLSARANLAIVQRLLGDAELAYRNNSETLEALIAAVGPDHAVTLTCATNLASDLIALGDPQAAFERDTDTKTRSERMLGVEHPSTLACAVNLALDLRALDREQAADKIHADTMTRFRRVLGERHPATLNARENVRAECDVDPMPI